MDEKIHNDFSQSAELLLFYDVQRLRWVILAEPTLWLQIKILFIILERVTFYFVIFIRLGKFEWIHFIFCPVFEPKWKPFAQNGMDDLYIFTQIKIASCNMKRNKIFFQLKNNILNISFSKRNNKAG